MIHAPSSSAERPALVTAARVLGAAIARVAPDAKLAGGGVLFLPFPGFHYDVALERPLTPDDLREISRAFGELAAADLPLERLTVTGEEAHSLLARGPGLHTSRLRDGSGDTVTLVSLKGFVDLCDGAELPSSGACRSFHIYREVLEVSVGEAEAQPLRRLCGIVAEDPAELRREVARLERAMERDHRWIGRSLRLFEPVTTTPGTYVWLPGGAMIHALLRSRVREHLTEAGYIEVRSSGEHHAAHDAAYRAEPRGCAELPLRLFELFSCSSPDKPSLCSTGIRRASPLTRDLESVFCLQQELHEEIRKLAMVAKGIHETFALPLRAEVTTGSGESPDLAGAIEDAGISVVRVSEPLSTQPEAVLRTVNVFGYFQHEAGRILFDGPREREDLTCVPNGARASKTGVAPRPVTTIRASLFSSLESLVAAVLEQTSGFLPLWLSPVQVMVVSVTTEVADYAREVHGGLCASGLRCELDTRRNKVQTKLRDAVVRKIPFTVVVGEREKADRTVSFRSRARFEEPIVLRSDEFRAKLLHELETWPRRCRESI